MGTRADLLRLGCFLTGLLLLAGSVPLTYLRITGLVEDAARVERTLEVLGAVEALRGDSSAVEAARRAQVITGDESFKERLKVALAELRADVAVLKSLTADEAEQQRTLADLAALVERRIAQVEAFAAEGAVDVSAQRERIHLGIGLAGEITALLDRMREVENRLLQERTRVSKEDARFTIAAALISGALGVVVVVAAFVLFVRETRERRRSEARLEEAGRKIAADAARIHAFFESSLDLAGVAGFDGHFKEVSASWKRLLGWTREEILAQPWLHFVHPDDHAATVREAEKLQQGGQTLNFENRYRCKDGSHRWIAWSVPAPAPGTDVLYCLGRDVTLLKELSAEVAVATAELQAFFDSSLDLACVAGIDGKFKKVNLSWERLLGWSREEILAHPWVEIVHPEDRAGAIRLAEQVQQGSRGALFENRIRCKDGSYRWIAWSVPAPAPGTTSVFSLGRDVTELKAQEARLQTLNAKLGEVNRELEAFSYSVSHDLRAPLRHANGFVELLEKHAGPVLDDKSRRYLRVIAEASSRMGRLIDDLLSFSRMGRAEMKPARVSMDKLVGEVRSELSADGRAVAWDVRPLPDADGDSSMLRQVWVNLLSNAVKYTKHREQARIEVGFAALNGKGEAYYVRDNGAGFDMAYVGKLFGVFQRLHSAQEFEGTGIGLANVKRIVDRHGGRIWAEGKVGEGAVFYFTVPLAGEERR